TRSRSPYTPVFRSGRRSAGVQRQYTGTAGKITNCQIGVFCSYANPDRQRVLIDRELYLPESWFADPGRLVDAGVPEHTRFATKPELAWKMIERAADDPRSEEHTSELQSRENLVCRLLLEKKKENKKEEKQKISK